MTGLYMKYDAWLKWVNRVKQRREIDREYFD